MYTWLIARMYVCIYVCMYVCIHLFNSKDTSFVTWFKSGLIVFILLLLLLFILLLLLMLLLLLLMLLLFASIKKGLIEKRESLFYKIWELLLLPEYCILTLFLYLT